MAMSEANEREVPVITSILAPCESKYRPAKIEPAKVRVVWTDEIHLSIRQHEEQAASCDCETAHATEDLEYTFNGPSR
jgi:hypothetical protein